GVDVIEAEKKRKKVLATFFGHRPGSSSRSILHHAAQAQPGALLGRCGRQFRCGRRPVLSVLRGGGRVRRGRARNSTLDFCCSSESLGGSGVSAHRLKKLDDRRRWTV